LEGGQPALDLFRSRKDLEEQAQRAKEMPSAQNTFRVLCLNQRVNMFSPLIGKDEWFACQGEAEIAPGEDVYLALDLSSVDDLTALVMVVRRRHRPGAGRSSGSRKTCWSGTARGTTSIIGRGAMPGIC
jgi:phage terminase large subunit-like protein